MDKSTVFIQIIFLALVLALPAKGQFMNFQIDIDAELSTTVERPLDFGTLIINSGPNTIELGDPRMGIFRIDALRTQRMLISLEVPDYLRMEFGPESARIPIEMYAAFSNFGEDNWRTAQPFRTPLQEIIVDSPQNNPDAIWSSAYIYIYGMIDIGTIPEGVYTGDIVLSIIYD
jgi:hypothetical protein